MAGKKDRKFVSIGKKIIWNITIITVIVAIIFGQKTYAEYIHAKNREEQ